MDDKKDTPIEAQEYLYGVRVVDIGDLRVARGLSRRHHSGCRHRSMIYDKNERRIWCPDCEHDVEAFDAFLLLVENFASKTKSLEERAAALLEAEKHSVFNFAAKEIDKAWRKKKWVPACPCCGAGLFPEDFRHGCAMVGREYARRLREKMNKVVPA